MDLVHDILLKQSLNGFNLLTILWPAGFEEDSTASGLYELGDLKHKSGKTGGGGGGEQKCISSLKTMELLLKK